MKKKEMDKIIAFDTLFTNNQIQMYKILLTYLEPSVQQKFAIYIKLMELQYTMHFFQAHPHAALKALPKEDFQSSSQLVEEIIPFCDSFQKEQLCQMQNMLQNLENMQEMMEMIQMMKELFPEGMGNPNADSCGSGMDMTQLFNMLGENDMSGMFHMFTNSADFQNQSSPSDS